MPSDMAVDYDGLIPNNVGLNADPRLRRALESWHPDSIPFELFWQAVLGLVGKVQPPPPPPPPPPK
jgi:hypothetical protein